MTHRTTPITNIINEGIRARMIRNAMSYNKFLTEIYLCLKSIDVLLCFTHPDDRHQFETELGLHKKL